MSDKIISKGNNLKCRRGNRGVKKSSEPNDSDLSAIFSSFLDLSGSFESKSLRRPKIPLNHAPFVEKNAEIHQMVVESSDWNTVSKNGKKQRKRKNKNPQQNQVQSQSLQTQDVCKEHNSIQHEEKNHMIAETNDSKKLPKILKRQRKKKNVIQSQKTISIQTNEVSIKAQVISLQTDEDNLLETPQIVAAEFNATAISSQEVSL